MKKSALFKECKNCRNWDLAERYLSSPLVLEMDDGELVDLDWEDSRTPLAMQILDRVEQYRGENEDLPSFESSYLCVPITSNLWQRSRR